VLTQGLDSPAQPTVGAHNKPAEVAAQQRRPRPRSVVTASGWAFTTLAALVLGFGVYLFGLSSLQQSRSQANLYKTLRHQLAEAVAPVAPTSPGSPVAVLNIPSVWLRNSVVVEGTSAAALTLGPGHRVNSALPGQAGVAAIFGRRTTFGAPFGRLRQLRPGDPILVTTGLGTCLYSVSEVSDAGQALTDTSPNRLLLVTADQATWPGGSVIVSARLRGVPKGPASAAMPALTPQERAMAADPGSLTSLLLWSLALLVLTICWSVGRLCCSVWTAHLVAVPLLIPILWNVYEDASQLLPNLY
jgi:sortase A